MSFPQTFSKGDVRRSANNQADVVALKFDGFVEVADAAQASAPKESYEDLQAAAKELGIPANQSREALTQAIADELGDDE